MNNGKCSYVYFNKSDKLTIGIFSNTKTLDELKPIWDRLGTDPLDETYRYLSEKGWMKGHFTGGDVDYVWREANEDIEIRLEGSE